VRDILEILAEARRLLATGIDRPKVDSFIAESTGQTITTLAELQEAVDSGQTEVRPTIVSFGEELRGAGESISALDQLVRGADINTIIPKLAKGLVNFAKEGIQSFRKNPIAASKQAFDVVGEIATDPGSFGPAGAALAPLGAFKKANEALRTARLAKKAAAKAAGTSRKSASALSAGRNTDDVAVAVSRAHAEFGGSTIDARTGRNLAGDDLLAVARKEGEQLFAENPTPAQVRAFIKKNQKALDADPDLRVASWFDEAGKVHPLETPHELNLTKTFAGDQMEAANAFAEAEGQFGFLNLAHPDFKVVRTGDLVAQKSLQAELDLLLLGRQTKERQREIMLEIAATALFAAGANPEAAAAGEVLGRQAAEAAGINSETLDAMLELDPQGTPAFLQLMSEQPDLSFEQLERFGINMGLDEGLADLVAQSIGVPAQPKSAAERADSIINDPNRTPSIPGRFWEGAKQGFPIQQFLDMLEFMERDRRALSQPRGDPVSSTRPGLLTRGELGR
jgi:hypothetical protein